MFKYGQEEAQQSSALTECLHSPSLRVTPIHGSGLFKESQGLLGGSGICCVRAWTDTLLSVLVGHIIGTGSFAQPVAGEGAVQSVFTGQADLHTAWPMEGLALLMGWAGFPTGFPVCQSVLCQHAQQQVVSFLTSTLNWGRIESPALSVLGLLSPCQCFH